MRNVHSVKAKAFFKNVGGFRHLIALYLCLSTVKTMDNNCFASNTNPNYPSRNPAVAVNTKTRRLANRHTSKWPGTPLQLLSTSRVADHCITCSVRRPVRQAVIVSFQVGGAVKLRCHVTSAAHVTSSRHGLMSAVSHRLGEEGHLP